MNRAPIRLRLTAWYVVVIAAALAALIAFVTTRLRSDLTAELDRSLRAGAEQIARGYRPEGPAEFLDTARTVLPGSRSERSGAQLLDASGRVLLSEGAIQRRPLIDRLAVDQALAGRTVLRARRLDGPHISVQDHDPRGSSFIVALPTGVTSSRPAPHEHPHRTIA